MERTGSNAHRKEEENKGIGISYSVDTTASLQHPLNTERELTSKDAGFLLAQAEKLQSLEGALIPDEVTTRLADAAVEDKITLEDTYKVATDMGIKTEYVDRLLSVYFPSRQQMAEDLREINARPSGDMWVAKMRALYSWIVPTLTRTFSFQKFRIEMASSLTDRVCRVDEKKEEYTTLFLRRKKILLYTEKVAIVEMSYNLSLNGEPRLYFSIQHPSFLRACGEDFKKTNESARKLGIRVDIEYDYVV